MKETIFKAQVYNDSEKTRVKQHKIFRDYLSVTANLKFAVLFLSACYKTSTHLKLNRKLRGLLLAILKTEKLE